LLRYSQGFFTSFQIKSLCLATGAWQRLSTIQKKHPH
jgi:hypothetical protein